MAGSIGSDVILLGLSAKDLLIAGGWFFTIIGWIVSSSQADNREKRKEVRSEVDACSKLATELLTKARRYFASASSDLTSKGVAAEIRFELQRLLTRVERLESNYAAFEVVGACGELMDSITGDPFESSSRQEVAADSDLLLKIESDILFLIDHMEAGFAKEFG